MLFWVKHVIELFIASETITWAQQLDGQGGI